MPDDELRQIVLAAKTFKEVLARLGFSTRGGALRILKLRLQNSDISTNHFIGRVEAAQLLNWVPITDKLIKGFAGNSQHLKQRLIKEGLLHEVCSICGIGPMWNGKPLVLQLDHKNGDRTDFRLENLRLVCPNCHSQTMTFGRSGNQRMNRLF